MSKGFASIVILLGIVVIILIGGVVVYQKVLVPKVQPTPVPVISPSPNLSPTITPVSSVSQPSPIPGLIVNWKTYTNAEAGFSLKYPSSAILGTSNYLSLNSITQLTLNIIVNKIDSIVQEAPYRYTKEDALGEEKSLETGQFGKDYDFSFSDSKKVIQISAKYGKTYTVFGRFHTCDIIFERWLVFYNKNYQVQIVLSTPKDEILAGMSQYFQIPTVTDQLPCWDTEKNNDPYSLFYKDLLNKRASSPAQVWYDTFDQILSTFKFLD